MIVLAVLCLVVPAACDVSINEEDELGDRHAEELLEQVRLVDDPVVTSHVEQLGARIARVTDEPRRDWHFYVVDDSVVNAFAVPGGHVFINRGLIERAGSWSELAGVMGHEVAHVALRHSVEQMQTRQRTNIAVTVFCSLLGLCEGAATRVVIGVGGQVLFAKYGRKDEAEADSAGVRYLVRAGIDPRGVPAMFGRLLEERRRSPSRLEAWFGSHPVEEDRIDQTTALIARYPAAALDNLARDVEQFALVQRRLHPRN